MAPSTLGTFLRSFTFGHVRQLDRACELALSAAWAAGAGPGEGELTIDIDSSICVVYGYDKEGPPTATPMSWATTPTATGPLSTRPGGFTTGKIGVSPDRTSTGWLTRASARLRHDRSYALKRPSELLDAVDPS